MDIIATWIFLWLKTKYVFFFVYLFCMSMKENLVITIWFGFVRDNTTWNNTMLGFVMDFENGMKEKCFDFTFFWSSMHLFCPICFVVLTFCYFNFNSWKHLFCLIVLAIIMFVCSSKDLCVSICFVIFAFAYGKNHNQRNHPSDWTLLKFAILYVWKITKEA